MACLYFLYWSSTLRGFLSLSLPIKLGYGRSTLFYHIACNIGLLCLLPLATLLLIQMEEISLEKKKRKRI